MLEIQYLHVTVSDKSNKTILFFEQTQDNVIIFSHNGKDDCQSYGIFIYILIKCFGNKMITL